MQVCYDNLLLRFNMLSVHVILPPSDLDAHIRQKMPNELMRDIMMHEIINLFHSI